jgi:hypothetical protein
MTHSLLPESAIVNALPRWIGMAEAGAVWTLPRGWKRQRRRSRPRSQFPKARAVYSDRLESQRAILKMLCMGLRNL